VINFHDWPLDRRSAPAEYDGPVAADFASCLRIVRSLVKPERDALIGRNPMATRRGEAWWRYAGEAKNMYIAIKDMGRVVVRTRVSNTDAVALVDCRQVLSDQIVVFAFDSLSAFALLQSFAHGVWTLANASSMRTDIRYTPTDCFETFARPPTSTVAWKLLEDIGARYDTHRREVMLANQEGLTKTYNRFHSHGEKSVFVRKLRTLHVEMDEAVKQAYGWDDLSLDHGFHETKQGPRYTISEAAGGAVLDRLLELNHARYAEEVKAGLHDAGADGKAKPAVVVKRKPATKGKKGMAAAKQAGLFGDEGDGG